MKLHRHFCRISMLAFCVAGTGAIYAQPSQSFFASDFSQQTETTMPKQTTHASLNALIPASYQLTNRRKVIVDQESAELVRYERKDGRNTGLGGEHFSAVFTVNGKLKGFARMSLDLVGKALPSREQSETIARTFLQRHAPELLENMKIHWIEPHDESIHINQNGQKKTVTLTGMKVKVRNLADGRWFWIIVGSQGVPFVFERDIVWISFPGRRQTQKWLHDDWLKKQLTKESRQS